jgi:hypothetical protein
MITGGRTASGPRAAYPGRGQAARRLYPRRRFRNRRALGQSLRWHLAHTRATRRRRCRHVGRADHRWRRMRSGHRVDDRRIRWRRARAAAPGRYRDRCADTGSWGAPGRGRFGAARLRHTRFAYAPRTPATLVAPTVCSRKLRSVSIGTKKSRCSRAPSTHPTTSPICGFAGRRP